jgi:hypothetical protein
VRLPASQHAALQNIKGLQRAYSLKDELDSNWAVRPIEFANHWDRTVLVMEDPGGLPLDQLLGQPLDMALSLRIAISLSSAIGRPRDNVTADAVRRIGIFPLDPARVAP